ncbi:MAG TPA: hypothetical protein VIT64_01460 [Ilumatobacteraceae bacterium]
MSTPSIRRLPALLLLLVAAACSGSGGAGAGTTAVGPAGPVGPSTTAARPVVELPANGSIVVADAGALVFYGPDGELRGSAPITLRDEPLIELGNDRALGVTESGAVVLLDGAGGTVSVLDGITVPDGEQLNRDVLGGGDRFTIAQVANDPYLVDLDASTATLLTAITTTGRRVQGWRFSADERFVASSGTYLALVPTADPAAVAPLAELAGCVSIDAGGRLLVSETGGEIGSVSLATVDDPTAKQGLFAGSTKCALWWGKRIVAYGTGALVELQTDGTTSELLDLEPGQVVTLPVAGHPELVSVSGGVNPNQWFWLLPDNSLLAIPEAEGGRYVDVVGATAAFSVDSATGFDLVVAAQQNGATTITAFTDEQLGTRVLDVEGTAFLGAADSASVVGVTGGTTPTIIEGGADFVLAPDRSGSFAVALPEGVAITDRSASPSPIVLGPGTPLAWLAA